MVAFNWSASAESALEAGNPPNVVRRGTAPRRRAEGRSMLAAGKPNPTRPNPQVWALTRAFSALAPGSGAEPAMRAFFLRVAFHLVGDLHQAGK